MTKGDKHRLPIVFDEKTWDDLEKLLKKSGFSTKAALIKESLILRNTIQELHEQGFTTLKCFNSLGHEREIKLKSLK
jgi:hypothetical protein